MSDRHRRVGIVTGGSRGLGRVIAGVLTARGIAAVIGGRDIAALDEAASALRTAGGTVATVDGDITNAKVRSRLVRAGEEFGGLDIPVHKRPEPVPTGPLSQADV